ncbi:MAG: FMN-binding protein [Acidothermus cellulolyticus]|nr:FMN-binding protein [Acidothermus cellulolyticus]MCL6551083.1 FMN-binding protein [Acidothermus cellulolyticus]
MRRFVLTLAATVIGLVLLLQFKTTPLGGGANTALGIAGGSTSSGAGNSQAGTSANSASNGGTAEHSAAAGPTAGAAPTPPKTSSGGGSSAGGTVTVTGSAVPVTEGFRTFGTIQLRVTISNGKITDIQAINYPHNDPHSYEVSLYALPILRQEALAAQSAQIDAVSGATWTSEAYAQSLQAALDAAKSK